MKTIIIGLCLLATFAAADLGENYSTATITNHFANLPVGVIDYFVGMDLWLVAIFWKYIMYGTFYVLGE